MSLDSFQASDFLGQWYNVNPNPTNATLSYLFVNENQGTYTIDVVQRCIYTINGCQSLDWGTSTLSISPPNAHAFYTFQSGGSVDLQLKLLNATSMQVKESFQGSPPYATSVSTVVGYEQFTKLQLSYVTTSSSVTTQVVSTTVTLPAPGESSCGVSFKAGFNATAGQILTGSVSASTVVGVYVMTPAADQAWVYQFKWEGGSCTPSSSVAILQNSASYDVNVRIPTDGNYELIIINPSETSITVQIVLNLIPGTGGSSQTVQSQSSATTTTAMTNTQISQPSSFEWWVFDENANGYQPPIYLYTGSPLSIDVGWINAGGCFSSADPLSSQLTLSHLESFTGHAAANYTIETTQFDDQRTRQGSYTLELPGFSDQSDEGPTGLWTVHMTLSGQSCNAEANYSFYVITWQDRRSGNLSSDKSTYQQSDDPIVSWNSECANLPGAVGYLQYSIPDQPGYYGFYQMTDSEMRADSMNLRTDFSLISLYSGKWLVSVVIVTPLASDHCWSNATSLAFQVLPNTTASNQSTNSYFGEGPSVACGVTNVGKVPIVDIHVRLCSRTRLNELSGTILTS
jgi:hypothetical protein